MSDIVLTISTVLVAVVALRVLHLYSKREDLENYEYLRISLGYHVGIGDDISSMNFLMEKGYSWNRAVPIVTKLNPRTRFKRYD